MQGLRHVRKRGGVLRRWPRVARDDHDDADDGRQALERVGRRTKDI